MHRNTARFTAFLVLALLGAPVTMHVLLHDLHDHHAEHADGAGMREGEHEHPIVGSPAPTVPSLTRAGLTVAAQSGASVMTARAATAERNILAFGALRIDTDVGLQPLLATFLI